MNGAGQFYDRQFIDYPLSGVSTPGTALVSAIRNDISSWADLAAVPTFGAALPVILEWYDPVASLIRSTTLLAGTDATDTANGIQRPDDYDAVNNAVVFYQIGGAG